MAAKVLEVKSYRLNTLSCLVCFDCPPGPYILAAHDQLSTSVDTAPNPKLNPCPSAQRRRVTLTIVPTVNPITQISNLLKLYSRTTLDCRTQYPCRSSLPTNEAENEAFTDYTKNTTHYPYLICTTSRLTSANFNVHFTRLMSAARIAGPKDLIIISASAESSHPPAFSAPIAPLSHEVPLCQDVLALLMIHRILCQCLGRLTVGEKLDFLPFFLLVDPIHLPFNWLRNLTSSAGRVIPI